MPNYLYNLTLNKPVQTCYLNLLLDLSSPHLISKTRKYRLFDLIKPPIQHNFVYKHSKCINYGISLRLSRISVLSLGPALT